MSTPQLELISYRLCPYVQRAIITLIEKNIPHERTYIDLSNKPEWFQQISPLGKVPLLKVNGEVLFESMVICEYLDEITPGSLHPTDPLQKAKHRSWIEFGSGILSSISGFYNAPDQAAFEQKCDELERKFRWVEAAINEDVYFASNETLSLVDIVYGPIFRYFDVFDEIGKFGIFDNMPKVKKWRQLLQQRHSYLSTLIQGNEDQLNEK